MSRVSKYVCVVVLCMTVQAHAQLAVFDASNFSQNVVTAKQSLLMTFKQIQQYCLQIQQYEQQISTICKHGQKYCCAYSLCMGPGACNDE